MGLIDRIEISECQVMDKLSVGDCQTIDEVLISYRHATARGFDKVSRCFRPVIGELSTSYCDFEIRNLSSNSQ